MNSFKDAVKTIQLVLHEEDATNEQIMSVINVAAKTHAGSLWLCAVCKYAAQLHTSDSLIKYELDRKLEALPEYLRKEIVPDTLSHAIFSPLYLACLFLKTDLSAWTEKEYNLSVSYLTLLSDKLTKTVAEISNKE